MPFAIPEKWKWAHLSQAGSFVGGYTPKEAELSDKGEIPYFKVSDMNRPGNEQELVNTEKYLITKPKRVFLPGTIVYPKNGGAVFTNKRRLLKLESVIDLNTGGYVPGENLIPEYAFEFFKGLDFQKISKGTALPTIDQEKLRLTLIPIPPLLEQRRIVAKLNELLSLVETYGKEQEALEKMEKEFPDKLRASLLQEAIQGKLVPQLESEPEVAQIGEVPENVPFAIPQKWKWVPVNKIIELISGRDLDKSLIEEKASSSSVPYITGASQISNNDVLVNRWTNNGSVFSNTGDLLLTCKGTVGRLAINQIGICHIARQIMAIRPKDQISGDFAKIFFSAIGNKLTSNAKSMIPGISRNDVLSLLCPLPPIEEQHRIVAKLNELLDSVKHLEYNVSKT